MNRRVRRRLEAAVRTREFSRAHPSADASYASVVGQLEDGVTRLQVLSQQQRNGYALRSSATNRRRELRRRIRDELLPHLVMTGAAAAREKPGLVDWFRLPAGNANHEKFQTDARRLLERGTAERELLVKHGLAESLLDDLAAAITEFERSVVESAEALRQHVGASAELEKVAGEVMAIVDVLDGLNRYRFGSDGELAAAWASARRVVGMPRGPESDTGPVAAGPPVGGGGGSEVEPAA